MANSSWKKYEFLLRPTEFVFFTFAQGPYGSLRASTTHQKVRIRIGANQIRTFYTGPRSYEFLPYDISGPTDIKDHGKYEFALGSARFVSFILAQDPTDYHWDTRRPYDISRAYGHSNPTKKYEFAEEQAKFVFFISTRVPTRPTAYDTVP